MYSTARSLRRAAPRHCRVHTRETLLTAYPPKVQRERESYTDPKLVDVKKPDSESLTEKAARAGREIAANVAATLRGVREQVLRGGPSLGEHLPGNKHQHE